MQTPAEVLERLVRGASARRAASLRTIDAVCLKQREDRSIDYSLQTLGRLSQASGGPAERALRNPAGAPYRELIEAHRFAAGVLPKSKRMPRDPDDALLSDIRDPALRARLALMLGELRELRLKYRTLQKVAENTGEIIMTAPAQGAFSEAITQVRAAVDLQPMERTALRDAPRQLKSVGMTIDANGRIRLPDGRVAFPVGYATAMDKIARELGAPPVEEPSIRDDALVTVTDATS